MRHYTPTLHDLHLTGRAHEIRTTSDRPRCYLQQVVKLYEKLDAMPAVFEISLTIKPQKFGGNSCTLKEDVGAILIPLTQLSKLRQTDLQ